MVRKNNNKRKKQKKALKEGQARLSRSQSDQSLKAASPEPTRIYPTTEESSEESDSDSVSSSPNKCSLVRPSQVIKPSLPKPGQTAARTQPWLGSVFHQPSTSAKPTIGAQATSRPLLVGATFGQTFTPTIPARPSKQQAKEIEDGKVKQERSGVVLQGSPKGAIKKTKSKSALNSPARSFSYSEDSLRRVPQSATRSSVSLSECKPSGSQSEFYSPIDAEKESKFNDSESQPSTSEDSNPEVRIHKKLSGEELERSKKLYHSLRSFLKLTPRPIQQEDGEPKPQMKQKSNEISFEEIYPNTEVIPDLTIREALRQLACLENTTGYRNLLLKQYQRLPESKQNDDFLTMYYGVLYSWYQQTHAKRLMPIAPLPSSGSNSSRCSSCENVSNAATFDTSSDGSRVRMEEVEIVLSDDDDTLKEIAAIEDQVAECPEEENFLGIQFQPPLVREFKVLTPTPARATSSEPDLEEELNISNSPVEEMESLCISDD